MKTRLSVLVVLVAGLSLVLWQTATAQEPVVLQPVEINWEAEDILAGDRLEVTVELRNTGTEAAPSGSAYVLTLAIDDASRCDADEDAPQALITVESDLVLAADVAPGATTTTEAIEIIVPGEGDYFLSAQAASEDENVGGGCDDIIIRVGTALPPSIAQLLAGLGTFAAVMAIMALGTEVTIDSLKYFIGLKQKVTAMEAFDKLEAELPGRLAALGVTADKRAAVKETLRQVRNTLEPVETAQQAYALVQKGDFSGAYAAIVALAPAVGQQADAEVERLKAEARVGIQQGFVKLCERLDLPAELKADVEKYCLELIDNVTVNSAATLLDDIFNAIQARAPKLTEAWLEAQIDGALSGGKAEITRLIDTEVLPALTGLGFAAGPAERVLKQWLDEAEAAAGAEVDEYLVALRELLKGVEIRRNEMQSPLRKIYRRLRRSDVAAAAALAAVVAGYVALLVVGRALDSAGDELLLGNLLWQWLLTGITAVVVGALVHRLVRQGEPEPPDPPLPLPAGTTLDAWEAQWRLENRSPSQRSLGAVLRAVEHAYNRALGRAEEDPSMYGAVKSWIEELIADITATTAAETLLRLEDQHRDEEASRLRVLRVIAIFVGFLLAYLIQIDAVLLLAEAVPGILGINQIVNISADTLNKAIPWFELPPNNRVTTGIILTGLAASAGSAFWHDFLGRLQGTKEATEATAKLLRRARDLPDQIE